jgi:hypothetical protein
MPVKTLTATSRDLAVGDRWLLGFLVLDNDLDLVDVTPTVAITLPNGAAGVAPALVTDKAGIYSFDYPVTVTGRHLATVTAPGYGTLSYVMWAASPTAGTQLPTVDDVDNYLKSGSGEHSWSTADMQDALDAETDAQRRVCRIRPVYPADLRQALLRRVQRNLALRPNALAMTRGDAENGDPQAPLPASDPEVRRLERPHRKLPIG